MNTEPIINPDTFGELRSMVGDEFLSELIDTFCTETPPIIGDLQRALAEGDADAFRRAAHSIKSSSANFGAVPFSALARELEILGREHNLAQVGDKVARLVADYGQLERALRELQHAS